MLLLSTWNVEIQYIGVKVHTLKAHMALGAIGRCPEYHNKNSFSLHSDDILSLYYESSDAKQSLVGQGCSVAAAAAALPWVVCMGKPDLRRQIIFECQRPRIPDLCSS